MHFEYMSIHINTKYIAILEKYSSKGWASVKYT